MNPQTPVQTPVVAVPVGSDRPCIASQQILRGHNMVEIEHAGQRYLLRVTRENKLILTK